MAGVVHMLDMASASHLDPARTVRVAPQLGHLVLAVDALRLHNVAELLLLDEAVHVHGIQDHGDLKWSMEAHT